MPGPLKMRSISSLVLFVVIPSAPKRYFSSASSSSRLGYILTKDLNEKVASPFTHTAQQFLDPLHGQGRRFGTAVFPAVDGREGHAELGREFFLG